MLKRSLRKQGVRLWTGLNRLGVSPLIDVHKDGNEVMKAKNFLGREHVESVTSSEVLVTIVIPLWTLNYCTMIDL
jgi:hypothetical protein